MAHHRTDLPALAVGDEALPALPSCGALRGIAATWTAELAVLLLRGSAVTILLSPALLGAFLLAG